MKQLAIALFAVVVAQSAMAVDYYHWNVVRTGGRLDEPNNWAQKKVPPSGTLCEMYYSQSGAFTMTNDLTTGMFYLYNITGGTGKYAEFDLAPYTLTLKCPSGWPAGLEVGGHSGLGVTRAALTSGKIKSSVYFNTSSSGGGNIFAVNGDEAVLEAGNVSFDNKNNRFEVLNGVTYGSFDMRGSTNTIRITGANSRYITRTTDSGWPRIGTAGSGNRFEVLDGALYSNECAAAGSYFRVGAADSGTSGSGHAILVSNATFKVLGQTVFLGRKSSSNEFAAVDGAKVQLAKSLQLGYEANNGSRTSGNRVFVSDSETVFEAGSVVIGYAMTEKNAMVVTNDATLRTTSTLYVGGEDAKHNQLYVGGNAKLELGGDFYVGYGGQASYNHAVLDGVTYVQKTGSTSVGYYGGDYNELELVNGATFVHTNTENQLLIGLAAGSVSNKLRVASGSVLKVYAIDVSYNSGSGSNILEFENGTYQGVAKPGIGTTPYVMFDRYSTRDSWLVLKGTNSWFNGLYTSTSKIRFEIPAEGLAAAKATQPVCNLGYVAGSPNEIVVDIDGKCPKGKWLLISWSDPASVTADGLIAKTTLTGEGAERARLVADGKNVYLKMRGTGGMSVIVR